MVSMIWVREGGSRTRKQAVNESIQDGKAKFALRSSVQIIPEVPIDRVLLVWCSENVNEACKRSSASHVKCCCRI